MTPTWNCYCTDSIHWLAQSNLDQAKPKFPDWADRGRASPWKLCFRPNSSQLGHWLRRLGSEYDCCFCMIFWWLDSNPFSAAWNRRAALWRPTETLESMCPVYGRNDQSEETETRDSIWIAKFRKKTKRKWNTKNDSRMKERRTREWNKANCPVSMSRREECASFSRALKRRRSFIWFYYFFSLSLSLSLYCCVCLMYLLVLEHDRGRLE